MAASLEIRGRNWALNGDRYVAARPLSRQAVISPLDWEFSTKIHQLGVQQASAVANRAAWQYHAASEKC
jgi:hypothetical protein